MTLIASDHRDSSLLAAVLEGFDCPAILVDADYRILATNLPYREAYGAIDATGSAHCFAVSHGYSQPCDLSGEDCPLKAAQTSGHREKVLHIHQTPRGPEHVDVELIPLRDEQGQLLCFIELLRPIPLVSGKQTPQEMLGQSRAFQQTLRNITRVARTEASVLLLGESGTGKELAARAIHLGSARAHKPLVTLECAGLTDSLFESELFGHVKGAFTGANTNKKGLVALADGGTLFLDEIGDVPLSMQVKLLRLLESGTYRPVGGAESQRADFRLVCATHKNIARMAAEGEFREDLYYRINVFPVHLPSLAERRDDIPLIAKALMARLGSKRTHHLTHSAIERLQQHHYKGNIRELRNILQRALILTDTNLIDRPVIERALHIDRPLKPIDTPPALAGIQDPPKDLKALEKVFFQRLLDDCGGNKTRAAKAAGISVRSLYRKLKD